MATGVASWSTTAASNSNADSNVNYAEGQAPSSLNDSGRALMASVAMYRDDMAGSLLTGGTSTAFTVTTNQGFGSLPLLNARTLVIRFNATNGASPTLSVDGLTAKAIRVDASTAVATGAIRANSIHHLTYDSSGGYFILHNGHSLVEPGRLADTAASSAPNGWLLCDGSAVSRTTYADLFAIISTTYGTGNGSTTFNVPDMRGRVSVGKDDMGGSAASRITNAQAGFVGTTLGAAGGDQRTQQHAHTLTDPGHDHDTVLQATSSGANGASLVWLKSDGGVNNDPKTLTSSSETTGITMANFGAGSSQNVQPSIVVNKIIKT